MKMMTRDEIVRLQLDALTREHRRLDACVTELTTRASTLELQRLKKKKLQLKDKISHLKDQISPDIIA